jgi:hypothetical protein
MHGTFHKMLPEHKHDTLEFENLENEWKGHFEG